MTPNRVQVSHVSPPQNVVLMRVFLFLTQILFTLCNDLLHKITLLCLQPRHTFCYIFILEHWKQKEKQLNSNNFVQVGLI